MDDHRPGDLDPIAGSRPPDRLPGEDSDGGLWANGRQIGRNTPDGPVDMHGNPIRIAVDDMGGGPVGYFEQPTGVPDGMQPVYGPGGRLAGHVDPHGRAVIDGRLQRVAIGPDGNLVPFDVPEAPIPPEWGTEITPGPGPTPSTRAGVDDDLAGTMAQQAPAEPQGPVQLGPYGDVQGPVVPGAAVSPDRLNIQQRVPVLGDDGQPAHFVEPGPRLVRPNHDGDLVYDHTRYPTPDQHPRGRDIKLDPSMPTAGLRDMPVPDRYGAQVESIPTGERAGPVRLDARGRRPTGMAGPLWEELRVPNGGRIDGFGSIDSNGVMRTESGQVVAGRLVNRRTGDVAGHVHADGSYRAPDGGPVDLIGLDFEPQVTIRNGAIVRYELVDGTVVDVPGS